MTEQPLHAVEEVAGYNAAHPAEIVAERVRILEEFVAEHGMDYWDHHEAPPRGGSA